MENRKNKNAAKKAIAYTRVSTDEQAKKYGLEAQRNAIRQYCDANDIEIVEWVSDEGISGAKERENFQKLIDGDHTGIDMIVVAKADRVARKIELYYYYKFSLERAGLTLLDVSNPDMDKDPVNRIYETITAIFAEMERSRIAERMQSGLKVKASKGGYTGGRPPYGYCSVNHELRIEPQEAEVVKAIFDLSYNKGYTQEEIADWLNEHGYRTRNGKKFNQCRISLMIKRKKTYQGYVKYNGAWMRGKHEPILK